MDKLAKKVESCKNTIVNQFFIIVPAVGSWQAPSVRFLLVLWIYYGGDLVKVVHKDVLGRFK